MSTGDGGVGELDAAVGGVGGAGSSHRDGEMLRSPALSLLMLLSPILFRKKIKNNQTNKQIQSNACQYMQRFGTSSIDVVASGNPPYSWNFVCTVVHRCRGQR